MRIALCGEARSGKDTVAKLLGRDFVRLAFGDFMKHNYYLAHPNLKDKPKDREHMIAWSQPQVEEYSRIWIDPLEETMNEMYNPYHNFVITDLRQPHEEQWCRDNGFHIVRVHANASQRYSRMEELGEKPTRDLSYWVNADFHIYNDGTLKDLEINTQKLLQVLESYDKIKSVTNEVNTRK